MILLLEHGSIEERCPAGIFETEHILVKADPALTGASRQACTHETTRVESSAFSLLTDAAEAIDNHLRSAIMKTRH